MKQADELTAARQRIAELEAQLAEAKDENALWRSEHEPCPYKIELAGARREGFGDGIYAAEQIAYAARDDEEYGHAAFHCIQIAQRIRALIDAKGRPEKAKEE